MKTNWQAMKRIKPGYLGNKQDLTALFGPPKFHVERKVTGRDESGKEQYELKFSPIDGAKNE